MIDFRNEQLLTLTEAAGLLPRRRRGKKPHVSTLHRWASRGLHGVKLETIQVGGTRCTTVGALQRFFDQLAGTTPPNPTQQNASSKRAIEAAEAELDEAGI